MEADLWELILEHLKEHGQEVVDGPRGSLVSIRESRLVVRFGYALLLSENWRKSRDLGTQSGPDMLRCVRHQVLDAAHDVVKKRITLNQGAEAGYLSCNGRPNFGFVILEELDKGWHQVSRDDLFIDRLGNL